MAIYTHLDVREVDPEKPPYHLLSDELLKVLDARYERRKDHPEEMAKVDYTPVPSHLLTHLVSHSFTVGELKVLLVILCAADTGEPISLTQFVKLTGLKRAVIIKSHEDLRERKIILSISEGSPTKTTYQINPHPHSWGLGDQKTPVCESPPPKPPPDPRIKVVMDYYYEKFQAKFGQAPVIHGAKDGSILKRLLAELELDRVKELMDIFFQTDDEFIIGSGYGLGVFSATINKLITQAVKTTGPAAAPEWAKDKT